MVVPNIYASSEWNFLHVTLLVKGDSYIFGILVGPLISE